MAPHPAQHLQITTRYGRIIKPWAPSEWASIEEAFARLSGPPETAARDLHLVIATGKLASGARHITSNKETDTFIRLKPAFWPDLAIVPSPGGERVYVTTRDRRPAPINAPGIRPVDPQHPRKTSGGDWYFFVRRVELDKLYPVATPSKAPSAEKSSLPNPPQRRTGPMTVHDWHSICGEIARRCIDAKTGRVAVPESERRLAEDVLQWCRNTSNNEPAESAIREAVKRVCAALRTVQK